MLQKSKTPDQKGKLIDTPKRPKGLRKIELSENGHSVFIRRYARRVLGA